MVLNITERERGEGEGVGTKLETKAPHMQAMYV